MTDIDVKYEIDEGVPIPVNRAPEIPLSKLEVGESIRFPKTQRASVQSNASRLSKETGKKFTVRLVEDGFCRVWRVE